MGTNSRLLKHHLTTDRTEDIQGQKRSFTETTEDIHRQHRENCVSVCVRCVAVLVPVIMFDPEKLLIYLKCRFSSFNSDTDSSPLEAALVQTETLHCPPSHENI